MTAAPIPAESPSEGSAEEQAAHVSAVISELKAIDADIVLLQEIRGPAALQVIIKAIPEHSLDVVSDFRGNLEVVILSRAPAAESLGTYPRCCYSMPFFISAPLFVYGAGEAAPAQFTGIR